MGKSAGSVSIIGGTDGPTSIFHVTPPGFLGRADEPGTAGQGRYGGLKGVF